MAASAAAGCDDAAVPAARVTASAPTRVVVTRDDRAAPRQCRPGPAAHEIVRFFDLQARGDARAASAYVRPDLAPGTQGYYAVERFTATTRQQAERYFAARHRKGERLRLVELSITYERRRRIGNIVYKLARRAKDVGAFRGGWNTEGKGAIKCAGGRIVAWAMSTVPRRTRTGFACPRPKRPDARPPAVVACAGR
jgi:hypothetical protein